jgi:hypothetical protein
MFEPIVAASHVRSTSATVGSKALTVETAGASAVKTAPSVAACTANKHNQFLAGRYGKNRGDPTTAPSLAPNWAAAGGA